MVILEYRRACQGQRREVVDGIIHTRGEARRREVMSKNSSIHHLLEECCAREEISHHVWNVFLPFREKSLLIASTAAKRNDNYFLLAWDICRPRKRRMQDCTSQSQARRIAQKLTSAVRESGSDFSRVES